jgi:hypothetical protein
MVWGASTSTGLPISHRNPACPAITILCCDEQVNDIRADLSPPILTLMDQLGDMLVAIPPEDHARIVMELIEEVEQKRSALHAMFPNYLALARSPI